MLLGQLQETARGGHFVPDGPGRVPWGGLLVMCCACPDSGRIDLMGNWNAWPPGTSFLQWFV